jgi:putative salt-induced outer membrane protein YdiY
MANGAGQADLGGKYDDGDLYIVTSLDHSWDRLKFETDIEFDYRYQDKNNITSTNKGLIAFKQRYELKPKHYVFSLARYDYNEFRTIDSRLQGNAGWGYKILRTEKIKMSNEFAMGILNTDMGNELIFRNSLWFFYKVAPKLTFSNKFLYEAANTPLIRNETEFNYLLSDKVKIGLKNIYTEDPRSDNILSFNLGYTW